MRKMLFLFSTIMLLTVPTACTDTNKEAEPSEETKVTPVETELVKKADLTVEQSVLGQVVPKKQVPVLFEMPGEVTEVKVRPGDEVSKDTTLATIKTQQGSFSVKAPIAGTVGQLAFDEDEFYDGETPFAVIFDAEEVKVQFSVTPEMKDKFTLEKEYTTKIQDRDYKAKVVKIESLPNETGQYELIASIDNSKGKIELGSVAEVFLKERLQKDALIVPTEAVITDSDESYVFVVEGDTVKKVAVDVLEIQTEETAIDGKVKEKDEIVVNGHFLLSDGSEVEVIKEGK